MVNLFIHRPIFAASIAILMLLAGAVAHLFLPVAQRPEVAPPQVVVAATYPGASSEVVANTVTTPLEQQINGVEGMAHMSSVSANDGSSTITITFNVGYPIDTAALDQATARARRDAAAYDYARRSQHRTATLSENGWATRDAFDQTTSALVATTWQDDSSSFNPVGMAPTWSNRGASVLRRTGEAS
jgi:hypothetical protein